MGITSSFFTPFTTGFLQLLIGNHDPIIYQFIFHRVQLLFPIAITQLLPPIRSDPEPRAWKKVPADRYPLAGESIPTGSAPNPFSLFFQFGSSQTWRTRQAAMYDWTINCGRRSERFIYACAFNFRIGANGFCTTRRRWSLDISPHVNYS